jgi:hypothetical protein
MTMRSVIGRLAAAAACAALALAVVGGCSSERSTMSLDVAAAPNPVTATVEDGQRRWDFQVTITNTNAVGVYVESFHVAISDTDTGYAVPLTLVSDQDIEIIGAYIAAGASRSYAASRPSQGRFGRGRERRIYHAVGNDGVYYSGDVEIVLQ